MVNIGYDQTGRTYILQLSYSIGLRLLWLLPGEVV